MIPEPDEDEEKQLLREMDEWLPKPGDKLIQETAGAFPVDPLGYSDPRNPAERSPLGRRDLYSGGFLEAGDRLVESSMTGPSDPALIYPVFYLYRHHLELELKGMILYSVNWLSGDDAEETKSSVSEQLNRTHGLLSLWETLKKCFPNYDKETPKAARVFENLLIELHKHDPDSQAARYPVDCRGNQTFSKLRSIDLEALKSGIHKMSHFLSGVHEGMAQEVDWRAEMASWGD